MTEKVNDSLYAAGLKFIEERGNQVVFGGALPATWSVSEEYGDLEPRPMESGELVIDRRFWLMLGKPEMLWVGFAIEAGWAKWVGTSLSVHARYRWYGASRWLETFEDGEIDA